MLYVKLILKHKVEVIFLSVIIISYFVLRLPNLTLQPIFADEAIYIRWAQVMRSEPTLRFLPQTDGKTPLFMWIMIPFFKFFHDPLFAGRFLSVLSGFFTLLGVFFLAKKVFNQRVALWAAFIYVITPYTVFFDRMALVDSMLSAFTIWIIYFAIWLAESVRLDIAMFLGYLLGGAILTKTPATINFLLVPLSILNFKIDKTKKNYFLRLFVLWLVAIGIGFLMYNILRLGPQFQLLSSRNQDYVFSPVELISRPLDPFIPHMKDMIDWFPKLFTPFTLIAVAIGIFFVIKSLNKRALTVLFWALLPMLFYMAFLKTFTARYLLTSIAPLLIFGGYGVQTISNVRFRISNKILSIIIFILIMVPSVYFDYQLLIIPPPNSLPKEERIGYFEDWTAGYGFSQIADILKEERKKGKVVVGTEGFFGTLPDGLYIYLDKADVSIIGSSATISAQLRDSAKNYPTYFVGNKKSIENSLKNVQLIKEYPKAKPADSNNIDATVLLKILP